MTSLIRQCNCGTSTASPRWWRSLPRRRNQARGRLAPPSPGLRGAGVFHPSLWGAGEDLWADGLARSTSCRSPSSSRDERGPGDVLRRALNKRTAPDRCDALEFMARRASSAGVSRRLKRSGLSGGFAGFMFNKATRQNTRRGFSRSVAEAALPAITWRRVLSNYRGFYAHCDAAQILYV